MSKEGHREFDAPRWALAIQHKDMTMFIEELDKMENIDARLLDIGRLFGFSPLGFALLGYDKGHAEFIRVLLERGADPNKTCQWHMDGETNTAMEVAARQYDDKTDTENCLALLRKYGGK